MSPKKANCLRRQKNCQYTCSRIQNAGGQFHPKGCYCHGYCRHMPSTYCLLFGGCSLGPTITEVLFQRELHYKACTAKLVSYCLALHPFPVPESLQTPKTPKQSVSKGRICPGVHTPGPWTAMGTVCKQCRACPFNLS